MTPLTVVATLKAKPGLEKKLGDVLKTLVVPTRAEKGCLNYDMHQSDEDAGLYVFHENWATRADWEAHMKTEHLVNFAAMQSDLAESWTLFSGHNVS